MRNILTFGILNANKMTKKTATNTTEWAGLNSNKPTEATPEQKQEFKNAYYAIGDNIEGLRNMKDSMRGTYDTKGALTSKGSRQLDLLISELCNKLATLRTWGNENLKNWD